ncbi:hypothetical protein PR048_011180 [Dryococelus australis]|uniref:Uncharacterized protein n=1 Tax=Dryococelus australis TaxID=614101 RepID=A0ABQ9HKW7_9NEOP|nr:hypothetical protein PR048_011180 [Dryococelus australis]
MPNCGFGVKAAAGGDEIWMCAFDMGQEDKKIYAANNIGKRWPAFALRDAVLTESRAFTCKLELVTSKLPSQKDSSPKRKDDSAYELSEQLGLSHLKEVPKNNLLITLKALSDVFLKKDQKLGCTDKFSNSIETCDAKPIYIRPYQFPQSQKETLKEQIQIMLDTAVIVTSASPWSAAPMILVTQKTVNVIKIRPVIDFSALNQINYNVMDRLLYWMRAPHYWVILALVLWGDTHLNSHYPPGRSACCYITPSSNGQDND